MTRKRDKMQSGGGTSSWPGAVSRAADWWRGQAVLCATDLDMFSHHIRSYCIADMIHTFFAVLCCATRCSLVCWWVPCCPSGSAP
jgi:hypothetical protein